MKWLHWLLPLLVLFIFAMPIWGADIGPPGNMVIEQTTDPANPADPTRSAAFHDRCMEPGHRHNILYNS